MIQNIAIFINSAFLQNKNQREIIFLHEKGYG